jgi:hypothetical protein
MQARARIEGPRSSRIGVAALLLALGGIVGISLLTGDHGDRSASFPSVTAATDRAVGSLAATAPSPTGGPVTDGPLEPGRYVMLPGSASIHLTLPAGWSSANGGTTLLRHPGAGAGAPMLTIAVHDVTGVAADICDPTAPALPIGPSVGELVRALRDQAGVLRFGPVAVPLGGHPAQRLELADGPDCEGPGVHRIWTNAAGADLTLQGTESAAVYVVDVFGERLVLVVEQRGVTRREDAEVGAIMASIDIAPARTAGGPIRGDPWVGQRWRELTVADTSVWLRIPRDPAWEGIRDGIYFSRSIVVPQDAEVIILVTALPASVPEPVPPENCLPILGATEGGTTDALAAAMAAAPGTKLKAAPTEVAVAGRPARHLAVAVRTDLGCGPGYFVDWHLQAGGAAWGGIQVGDTIDAWLVPIGEHHLVVEAIVRHGFERAVSDDIESIVDSIELQ